MLTQIIITAVTVLLNSIIAKSFTIYDVILSSVLTFVSVTCFFLWFVVYVFGALPLYRKLIPSAPRKDT